MAERRVMGEYVKREDVLSEIRAWKKFYWECQDTEALNAVGCIEADVKKMKGYTFEENER